MSDPNDFALTPVKPEAQGQAEADHYPTPPLLAREGLRAIVDLYGHPKVLLEPGSAGRAPFLSACYRPDWHRGWDTQLIGVELRDEPRPEIVAPQNWHPGTDYLRWLQPGDGLIVTDDNRRPDLIMTNPPFSLATEFIGHSLDLVRETGLVVMLLQTGIEGSKKRRDFWKRNRPILKLTPRPRPGFVKGGNDSREYAFYVFPGRRLQLLLRELGRDFFDSRFLDCPRDKGWGSAQ